MEDGHQVADPRIADAVAAATCELRSKLANAGDLIAALRATVEVEKLNGYILARKLQKYEPHPHENDQ